MQSALDLRQGLDQAVGKICADNEVSEGVSEPHHRVISTRHGEQVVKDREEKKSAENNNVSRV